MSESSESGEVLGWADAASVQATQAVQTKVPVSREHLGWIRDALRSEDPTCWARGVWQRYETRTGMGSSYRNKWQLVQVLASGWWSFLSLWQAMQVERVMALDPWVSWQAEQRWWFGFPWDPTEAMALWQAVHEGLPKR